MLMMDIQMYHKAPIYTGNNIGYQDRVQQIGNTWRKMKSEA